MWEFLEGTKTKPDYETEDIELEELKGEEESETDEAADLETESVDTVANLDKWLVCYNIIKYKKS